MNRKLPISFPAMVMSFLIGFAPANGLTTDDLPTPVNPLDPSPSRPSDGCPPDKGCEQGYWLVSAEGTVTGHGKRRAPDSGPISGTDRVAAMATNFSSDGYWLVTRTGQVHAVGNVEHFGDLVDRGPRPSPIVGMAPSGTYQGYWLVAEDGGIFAFGDAKDFGNAPLEADQRVVAILSVDRTNGYWLATEDGDVLTFGDVTDHGSLAGEDIPAPIVAMTSCYDQRYLLLGRDGSVYAFQGPNNRSATRIEGSASGAVGITRTNGCTGYWVAFADGTVTPVGDARALARHPRPPVPTVAIAL